MSVEYCSNTSFHYTARWLIMFVPYDFVFNASFARIHKHRMDSHCNVCAVCMPVEVAILTVLYKLLTSFFVYTSSSFRKILFNFRPKWNKLIQNEMWNVCEHGAVQQQALTVEATTFISKIPFSEPNSQIKHAFINEITFSSICFIFSSSTSTCLSKTKKQKKKQKLRSTKKKTLSSIIC